jgi:hypothetical protein
MFYLKASYIIFFILYILVYYLFIIFVKLKNAILYYELTILYI